MGASQVFATSRIEREKETTLIGLARKGVPWPYIITPQTDDEANCGHTTLLCDGDIEILVNALRGSKKWRDERLIAKLEDLRSE